MQSAASVVFILIVFVALTRAAVVGFVLCRDTETLTEYVASVLFEKCIYALLAVITDAAVTDWGLESARRHADGQRTLWSCVSLDQTECGRLCH